MKATLISLGDVVRAVSTLSPDPAALGRILGMLGLTEEPTVHVPPCLGPWQGSSPENVSVAQRQQPVPSAPAVNLPTEVPTKPDASSRSVVASAVRRVREGTGSFEPPPWIDEAGDLLDMDSPTGASSQAPSLFPRLTRRAILTAALATRVPEGAVDLDGIIAVLSACRPVQRLPRDPVPTLRRGAQVLVDTGEGMDPFTADQTAIAEALDQILADDRLQVLYFSNCPGRGVGSGPQESWGPWSPPSPGTPVILLTDLGIGGSPLDTERAGTDEWLAFAGRARAAGCTLTAFVPYEASRWPRALTRVITLIHWSERTAVGQVARAMRAL